MIFRYCFKLLSCCCLLFLATACSMVRPEPPEINLQSLQVNELSLTHASLLAGLRLYNPNAVALTIKRVDVDLAVNGQHLTHGSSVESTEIAAHGDSDLSLRLSSSYIQLLQFFATLQQQTDLNYRLKGTVDVGGLGVLERTFPIDSKGVISAEELLRNKP